MKVGILALQGAFLEHRNALESLGVNCQEIRQKSDLSGISALVLPGGESTVQGKLLHSLDLFSDLQKEIKEGLPVLATCAGLILLAQEIEGSSSPHLATLPVCVKRNAYGRQLGSFECTSTIGDIQDFPHTFIRAPYITRVSEGVEILSKVEDHIVGVSYQKQIGLAFHPEMTKDLRIHKMFLDLI